MGAAAEPSAAAGAEGPVTVEFVGVVFGAIGVALPAVAGPPGAVVEAVAEALGAGGVGSGGADASWGGGGGGSRRSRLPTRPDCMMSSLVARANAVPRSLSGRRLGGTGCWTSVAGGVPGGGDADKAALTARALRSPNMARGRRRRGCHSLADGELSVRIFDRPSWVRFMPEDDWNARAAPAR